LRCRATSQNVLSYHYMATHNTWIICVDWFMEPTLCRTQKANNVTELGGPSLAEPTSD
jgi:hypothetical protein